jgi:hypothetical protein
VSSRREVGLDSTLEAREPQLLEAGDLDRREALALELGERSAPEKCECLSELAPRGELPDTMQIELVVCDTQEVARAPGLDPVPADRLSQLRDVDLERLSRLRRRALVPERVDQPIAGDDPVGLEEQHGQQCALLCSAQVDLLSVVHDLERTQDLELHSPPPQSRRGDLIPQSRV